MRPSLRVVLCAVLAFASTAQAQDQTRVGAHQFSVTPRGGYIAFDKASGIENAAALGIDATYHLTPMFGIGASATFSRPKTNGDDFLGAMYLGDTTFIYRGSQPLTVANVNVDGDIRLPSFSRISPYIRGGIGGYTLFLDPQVSGNRDRIQRMSMNIGGGVGLRITDRVGVSLDVRDLIFTNYDRDRLNPVNLAGRPVRFNEDFSVPPAEKSTVHNIAFQIGFSFVPSLGDEEGGR